MSEYATRGKPVQYRLPQPIVDYVAERSERLGTTKTAVIVEAVTCLMHQESEGLMREGYREMSDLNLRVAEEGLAGSDDTLPEW